MSSYSSLLRMNFKDATPIGITLQRFILYTLATLSSANPPTNFIFMHVCKLETKLFEHKCRGCYHYQAKFCDAYPNHNIEHKCWISDIKSKSS
jgi:hypothetical protein